MDYYRPDTIQAALKLLEKGIPLAGGTVLTPQRYQLDAVVDLQDLGLDGCDLNEGFLEVGAMARVQDLLQWEGQLPLALYQAGQLEGGLNLRNMVTLGGLIMSADARSPLLTTLVALRTEVLVEPGEKVEKIGRILEERTQVKNPLLLTTIRIPLPSRSTYASVARSPADFPLVSAAAGVTEIEGAGIRWVVALGGFGNIPESHTGELDSSEDGGSDVIENAAKWAADAYAQADDPFASAAYRADVAGVLVRRVLKEVLEA